MKNGLPIFGGAALAFLCAAGIANAYVFDNFNGQANGALPSNSLGWTVQSGVIVSNKPGGDKALYIPISSGVTNSLVLSTNKVWTDFFTVPRFFVSTISTYTSAVGVVVSSRTAPDVDTNSTAQFFVNTNGMWVTISGNGAGLLYTNVCTNALVPGLTYPTVTQYSAYYHVSVLHDYSASNWSLFVNDVPIATNLAFIANGSVVQHTWFQVQNLAGETTNICWLDNFLLTNRMVTTGSGNVLTNKVPGTTMPVADVLMAFGSVQDPRPTNKTVGVVGAAAISLEFGRVYPDGRKYVVYGTPEYTLNNLSSNGVLSGTSYTDTVSLAGANTRQYYKLVTIAKDGSVAVTNDETYAAFKQYRTAGKYSVFGVPVGYLTPANRTMGGEMGDQLKTGLLDGDELTITTNGAAYRYFVNAGEWSSLDHKDDFLNIQWAPGIGMVVKSGLTGASYFAGLKETNALSVAIANGGWNYLTWPHNDVALNGDGSSVFGFVGSNKDIIYIQTNGAVNLTLATFDSATGKWRKGTYPYPEISMTLAPGDGVIYKAVGGGKVFNSNGP